MCGSVERLRRVTGISTLEYNDIQVASETVCLFPTPVPTGLFLGGLATKARTMTTTIADNEAPATTAAAMTAGLGASSSSPRCISDTYRQHCFDGDLPRY